MLVMAKARALAFAIAGVVGILAANSCSPFGGSGAFHCTDDISCSGGPGEGRCEPNGYCSFLDPACGEGGRSYGSESGPLSGVCVGAEPPVDAQVFEDAPPIVVDAVSPEAGETCYGAPTGYVQPCFAAPLTGQRMIAGDIDTDTGSADCNAMVSNTTHCVIAAGTLAIGAGTTVRVTGDRPLVLVAETLDIQGTLDVASKRQPERIGANSHPAGGCGTPTAAQASGGGAGGTLGGEGGNGGTGDGGGGGVAALPVAITALRGGCNGSVGKNSNNGNGGTAGRGGGAVYLIATALTVGANGVINASGAAGGAGVAGDAGGGGGGSGGFIGLDAATITNNGEIYANGGGGGEGDSNQSGNPGSEATSTAAAAGGTNGGMGGDGGAGGAATPAGDGRMSNDGGGGGGGGAGIVRTFRDTVGGAVSPPPS